MSQGDGDSEAESNDRNPATTGSGCYKNYEHYPLHRRNNIVPVRFSLALQQVYIFNNLGNSLQLNSAPEPETMPTYSPLPQRREAIRDINRENVQETADNEQLLGDGDEETPRHEKYMRASPGVSSNHYILPSPVYVSLYIILMS